MTWTKRVQTINEGDQVAYSAAWLRSTGQYTGDVPFARGVVKKLVPLGQTTLAEVDWGNPDIPSRVNVANLSRVTDKGIQDR
ncbi:MAG: hypothetical protein SGI88_03565 [Candidatus Hydrogenedentes bacterium]|nr:hypothetical protein [Candidatus Hydrogenedentota bacterium]